LNRRYVSKCKKFNKEGGWKEKRRLRRMQDKEASGHLTLNTTIKEE